MTENHFWFGWAVQAVAAFLTVLAVIVALFGERIRLWLYPPKLKIRLKSQRGETTTGTIRHQDGTRTPSVVRWYHIEVMNERRASQAHQVQVFLVAQEIKDAAGEYQTAWTGAVPLRWRDVALRGQTPTIGYPIEADLCSVTEDRWVKLRPARTQDGLTDEWREAFDCIVSVQAKSMEVDSKVLRVQIAWTGDWDRDSEKMTRHMVVREV